MSIVGEGIGALGLLGKGWGWLIDRIDPARAQAQRLIRAFEAYGVARQQIPRLLPTDLKLPNAAFSSPSRLKDKLEPELLDWAASYLALNRSWFDGMADSPHLIEDHYKAPAGYRDWLVERMELTPETARYLHIWKPYGQAVWPVGYGPLCLVYEECFQGLDSTKFSRYWLLSNQWSLHHVPCIENMVAVVAVARLLGILVLGRDLNMNALRQLDAGKKLIPEVRALVRGTWHPEDLIEPLPVKDTEWRKALWSGAAGYLAKDGIALPEMQSTTSPASGRVITPTL